MALLSKLISMPHSNDFVRESNRCLCDACGRMSDNPIRLTNLSADSMQIYNACPFCFSKLDEKIIFDKEPDDLKVPTSNTSSAILRKNQENKDHSEELECPHYLGYLKKRPKNTSIPEACLTCEKMIQCVL